MIPPSIGVLQGSSSILLSHGLTSKISYVVQQMCLHMHAPCTNHMFALKRIMCYVQGTLHYGLHLYSSPIEKLIFYTDVD